MKERHRVHALPTEKAIYGPTEVGSYINVLTKHTSHSGTVTWAYDKHMDGVQAQNPHHLYITSDEEIKEGDWCLIDEKYIHKNIENDAIYLKEHCRKIVAATDPSMWRRIFSHYSQDLMKIAVFKHDPTGVAQIGDDFIQAFVREQGIWEVDLEMEQMFSNEACAKEFNEPFLQPKLRSNGTVIWHPVKIRTWTDEQVKKMLRDYGADVCQAAVLRKEPVPFADDWFDEYCLK